MSDGKSKEERDSLLCLGTGDGWPDAGRNHSCYLYQLAGSRILIDCGEGACRSFTSRRFKWDDIDAVIISHTHSDHFGGIFMLLQGMWLDGRKRALTIHLPGHVIEPLKTMLQHVYLFPDLLKFRISFQPIQAGKTFRVGRVGVKAFANSHLEGLRRGFQKQHQLPFESFSFVLAGGGHRVVHTADIGPPSDLRPMLESPCDLLVCEFAHFSPRELIDEIRDCRIGKLILVHVSRQHRARISSIRQVLRRELPNVPHIVPDDGTSLEI